MKSPPPWRAFLFKGPTRFPLRPGSIIICPLAVVGDIKALALEVPPVPKRNEKFHHAKADRGSGRGPGDRYSNRCSLPHHLPD